MLQQNGRNQICMDFDIRETAYKLRIFPSNISTHRRYSDRKSSVYELWFDGDWYMICEHNHKVQCYANVDIKCSKGPCEMRDMILMKKNLYYLLYGHGEKKEVVV